MKFLGLDCAVKTLAYSYIDINTNIFQELAAMADWCTQLLTDYFGDQFPIRLIARDPDTIETLQFALGDDEFFEEIVAFCTELCAILGNFVKFNSRAVADLIPGKKISEADNIELTKNLRQYLDESDISVAKLHPETHVIIELQPQKVKQNKVNTKSPLISYELAMYYSAHQFAFIDPKLKNKIALSEDLQYTLFLEKYKTQKDPKYPARKAHSRANMEYFFKKFGLSHILDGIKKSVRDDLADSFMQILAHIIQTGLFFKE